MQMRVAARGSGPDHRGRREHRQMQRSRERHVRGGREQTGDARRPGGTIVVQLCRGAGHRGEGVRTRRGYHSGECAKEPELESMAGSVSLVKRSGSALTYAVDGQRWRGSPRSSLSVRPFGPAVQHPEGGSQLAEIETAGSVKKHRRSLLPPRETEMRSK